MNNTTLITTDEWFTEVHSNLGTAISVKIKSKLHEEKTPFQTISIYDTINLGNMMVIDGCIMVTEKDNFIYHEMMSHPVLFSHADPKNILIIGGGDCGTLKEVAKHPVTSITQVEIDEQVTILSEKYFPNLCTSNKDPRVKLYFKDAIKWVQTTNSDNFDIIIVDSTDPIGPGEGLFTIPFYTDCLRILKDDGILIHQSESPIFLLNLIKSMRKKMFTAGFSNLQTLYFPLPTYPSGFWSATMASKKINLKTFRNNISQIPHLNYYSPNIHSAALIAPPYLQKEFEVI